MKVWEQGEESALAGTTARGPAASTSVHAAHDASVASIDDVHQVNSHSRVVEACGGRRESADTKASVCCRRARVDWPIQNGAVKQRGRSMLHRLPIAPSS